MLAIPVLIVCYNRPLHLQTLLESIEKAHDCMSCDYFLVMDGARTAKDKIQQLEIESVIRSSSLEINLTKRESNLGLKANILLSITEIFEKFDTVIVLEDDLVLHPWALSWFLSRLDYFREDERIYHLGGHLKYRIGLNKTDLILPVMDCWGWATWRDKWNDANSISEDFIRENLIKMEIESKVSFNGFLGDNINQLRKNLFDRNYNTWAIFWQTRIVLRTGSCIYPSRNIVGNTGKDGSGTNYKFDTNKREARVKHIGFKREVEIKNIHLVDSASIFRYFLLRSYLNRQARRVIRLVRGVYK